jgi:hypothetical protein
MDENGNSLDDKKPVALSIVQGGKAPALPESSPILPESCVDTLEQIEDIRSKILDGRLSSMVLFAITSDGEHSKIILTKNRFELLGLSKDSHEFVQEIYKTQD